MGDAIQVEITADQARMMRHACGAKYHRRYYVACKGCEEDTLWMLLGMASYARVFDSNITTRTWHVTDAGVVALETFEAREGEPTGG